MMQKAAGARAGRAWPRNRGGTDAPSSTHVVNWVGAGTTGVLTSSLIVGRGSEAWAFEPAQEHQYDDGDIRISSNENARGPGQAAIDAIHEAMTPRMGRGYPPDHRDALVGTIAERYGVRASHVIIGTGSGPILAGATRAFCSERKPLVTAGPT
jgi:histidinol-phosphate/aromatic aminotransferase/cobyric acid decarboxylase-like protein